MASALRCDHSCMQCYANVCGRENVAGHRGYRRKRRPVEVKHVAIRKRVSVDSLDGVVHNAEVDVIQGACGLEKLAEFLCASSFEDGSVRARGTLLVFFEGGRWKLCLNDKAEGQVGFLSAMSLHDVLGEANESLIKDGIDWRVKREDFPTKRR